MLKLGATMILVALAFRPQFGRSNLGVLDAREAISFFIEEGRSVSGYRERDRDLAMMAFAAWSREGGGNLKFIESKERERALIRLRWISPTEGLYGETQRVEVNGKPGAIVYVMPQVSVQGEPLASRAVQDVLLRDTIVYLTCVHELGHAVGLSHTRKFEDIMYYFGYGGVNLDYLLRSPHKLPPPRAIARHSRLSMRGVGVLPRKYHV